MRVLDPGHLYELATLDGDGTPVLLRFVKREGAKYPGNVGHHDGTTTQEVLRACIDRLDYVNNQLPCAETQSARDLLAAAVVLMELRAARQHGHALEAKTADDIVWGKRCQKCGHIGCEVHGKELG